MRSLHIWFWCFHKIFWQKENYRTSPALSIRETHTYSIVWATLSFINLIDNDMFGPKGLTNCGRFNIWANLVHYVHSTSSLLTPSAAVSRPLSSSDSREASPWLLASWRDTSSWSSSTWACSCCEWPRATSTSCQASASWKHKEGHTHVNTFMNICGYKTHTHNESDV